MTEIIVSTSHRFLLPDQWNELTYAQLLTIAEDIFLYSQLTDEQRQIKLKTKIALRLSQLEPQEYMGEFAALEIARKVLPELDFLFTRNLLTEQKINSVLLRKGFSLLRFYGPAGNFTNLAFGEFDDAEYWFAELQNPLNEQREQALNMLLSILYRPAAWQSVPGDKRIAYNVHENEARAKWMATMPLPDKLVVLLWYMGCRNALVDDFKVLFDSRKSEDGTGGWTMLAHSLAGPALGDIDKVKARPVREVFYELLRLYIQAEQQEQG